MLGFASDMDGTLVYNGKFIKKTDIRRIKEFQEHGHLFGVCTGRPLAGIQDIRHDLNCDFYIAVSGAVILNKDFEIIDEHPIDFHIIKELYEQYHMHYFVVHTGNYEKIYVNQPKSDPLFSCFKDIQEIENEVIYGVSIIVDDEDLAYTINQKIQNDYAMLAGHLNINSVDITMKECSKGKGALFIKDYCRIDQICGIGDSYNDLSLLQDSDMSFTFPDSPQQLHTSASHIVGSVASAITIAEDIL